MSDFSRGDAAVIEDFLTGDPEEAVQFVARWVTGDVEGAVEHFSDHVRGGGSSLVARVKGSVVGLVTLRWISGNPRFAQQDIPLVHQLAVAPNFRGAGVATLLMDAAENLAFSKGKSCLGTTVGLLDDYGPAQRLYAKRGYIPDGQGACRGKVPLRLGDTVKVEHDLVLWLIKDLGS